MRKLLNSLYILEETAYLTLDGENIVCRAEDSERFRVPFTNIEDIYIFSYSGCSPALLGKSAEYCIDVIFSSPQRK
uniref:CRISPR-associated endonuclease Cas1 n=1 Tax=Ruminococcus bicirculans (ex Wegman et al. 2014) TaxID=1160721 RepID=UPI0040280236